MSEFDDTINLRECCEGISGLTPASLANRPGLSALAYRVGTHASFKTTMLARLSTVSALRTLTTRRDDDPSIALLDAWATVADVLTFYQERVANEGFLRTATERRSLLEMARLIGYELRPGVAASTYLAFTMEDTPGAPQKVIIPTGTRAQSVPEKEELPQTFETSEQIIARPEWNALRPRITYPQYFNKNTRRFYFKGTETNLKLGDWMLLLARESSDPDDTEDIHKVPLQVVRVEPNHDKQRTGVDLDESPEVPLPFAFEYPLVGQFSLVQQAFTGANIANVVTQSTWHASDLYAYAAVQRWPNASLARHVNTVTKAPEPAPDVGVFAMRVKAGPFGHNAPRWETTPKEWRVGNTPPYPPPGWENMNITTDATGTPYYEQYSHFIYLESAFREIRKDGWVIIKSETQKARVYQIEAASERSLADYGLSGKATGLTLDTSVGLTDYKVRETTIYAQSEKLELAELPFEENIKDDTVKLDSMQIDLTTGQTLILTGERADLEGVIDSEVVILADVVHAGGYTQLTFTRSLQHPYKRETVTLNANVARATHGETKQEVLGSGDASQTMQRLALRQKPLSYVSAPVPSGGISTLEVRINDVLWHEAPDLYRLGPEDRAYIIRHDDEGKTTVQFGDGTHGVRVPSGSENITAKYRIGIGLAGMVDADQVTLLQTRPLGVRSVTNPLAPTGAEDPETRDQARENAPLTVLTLDRIVSLQDFEDFARAFGGIGKASAIWMWDGESRIIHVTIAAANGDPVFSDSDLYRNLLEAMNRVRDPFQRLRIESFQPLLFNLDAAVRVHPDYEEEKVLTKVEATLRAAFSFTARAFGQSVALSEAMALIQQVEGVEAVDVNYFYYSHETETPSLEPLLSASPATLKPDGTIQPAQLLTITPAPISLSVMA